MYCNGLQISPISAYYCFIFSGLQCTRVLHASIGTIEDQGKILDDFDDLKVCILLDCRGSSVPESYSLSESMKKNWNL